MIIDCDRCEVRGNACASCVIGVLMRVDEDDRPIPYLPVDPPGTGDGPVPAVTAAHGAATGGPAPEPVEFAEPERRALQVLAEQGLIPPLRLVEPGRPAAPRPAAPLLPVPVVPDRAARHREAG